MLIGLDLFARLDPSGYCKAMNPPFVMAQVKRYITCETVEELINITEVTPVDDLAPTRQLLNSRNPYERQVFLKILGVLVEERINASPILAPPPNEQNPQKARSGLPPPSVTALSGHK